MSDDEFSLSFSPNEPPEVEPIDCLLGNGHRLRFEARFFAQVASIEEIHAGTPPEPIFAIRVYCSEASVRGRLLREEEFRDGFEFDASQIWRIWTWLAEFVHSRAFFEFDVFDDVLEHFAETISRFSAEGSDATEFYQRLPEIVLPALFDRFDDSLFNDQNDHQPGP